MAQPKRTQSKPPGASVTQREVQQLAERLREQVLQAPEKAAKILALWISEPKEKSKSQKKSA